ncbi:hypothetical protein [Streptomyces chartreusis]|uniref:Uncharacterized protein n=1 Tax=Streptomyces chartreusis TaxID=1969 RepID=A0A7H8T6X7_STRCX|nr:hypothetical protein [Streptomyces chartreusis]QKZ19084.1 hypothetical protein HUT05_17930 [Streptomyces chartreusis]
MQSYRIALPKGGFFDLPGYYPVIVVVLVLVLLGYDVGSAVAAVIAVGAAARELAATPAAERS